MKAPLGMVVLPDVVRTWGLLAIRRMPMLTAAPATRLTRLGRIEP